MTTISTEGTPVALTSGGGTSSFPISISGHLLLVLRDNAGNEFVIRGGPSSSTDGAYGPLILQINEPIGTSLDVREPGETAISRGATVLDLGDRDAVDVWNIIKQHAQNINAQGLPYDPLGFNSNGTVGNLLSVVGIDINDFTPDPDGIMLIPFSGKNLDFAFDYRILGTERSDIIVGRQGSQEFEGGLGEDRLFGGAGNDDLRGGRGNDVIDGGEGEDHAIFDGLRTDYRIAGPSGGAQTVTNIVTGEVDQLTSIECIKFESNSNIALTNSFVDHGNSSIPANDDGSSSFIDITSVFSNGLNFFGQDFTGVYVNNNGNITFGSPLSTYTPGIIGGASSLAIIAPFWGDVDTRDAGSLVKYGLDAERGTFTATWANVDYYNATTSDHTSIFNSFQLELIDQGCGDFEIIFRYADINWTTGDASNGTGGLGGNVARAGFSFGDQIHYFELPQSGYQSGMLQPGECCRQCGHRRLALFRARWRSDWYWHNRQ